MYKEYGTGTADCPAGTPKGGRYYNHENSRDPLGEPINGESMSGLERMATNSIRTTVKKIDFDKEREEWVNHPDFRCTD